MCIMASTVLVFHSLHCLHCVLYILGKGTVASRVVKQVGMVHVSSGDAFRLEIANDTGKPQICIYKKQREPMP